MEDKKIKDYVVIDHCNSCNDLQGEVLRYIKNGYVPQGGASSVYKGSGSYRYIQAMVKYEK